MKNLAPIAVLAVISAVACADEPAEKDASTPPDAVKAVEAMGEGFEPMIETVDTVQTNWTAGMVTVAASAKTKGKDDAARQAATQAARKAAADKAVEAISQLPTGLKETITRLTGGPLTAEAALTDLQQPDPSYDKQKRLVTTALQAALWGEKRSVQMPPLTPAVDYDAFTFLGDAVGGKGDSDGIVIDARGSGFKPALVPTVITAGKLRVFGPQDISADDLAERPAAIYVHADLPGPTEDNPLPQLKALAKAKKLARKLGSADKKLVAAAKQVFAKPLIVHADSVEATSPSTLILTASAERDLMLHGDVRELFRSGRVMIVADTKPEAEE
ncbi:MAG: hypothetical protein ACYS8X_02315 [Planctomycetota bacterium]|jgi:hypothetical protein